MVDLKLFDKNPLAQEIVEMEEYVEILKSELIHRVEYDETYEPDSFEGKIKELTNKKAIISIRSEIASKESFIKELTMKLLRDKEVVMVAYQDYLKVKPKFFEKLNTLELKTDFHKNFFNYLRAELASYEKWLHVEQSNYSITQNTGIIEGIVHYYSNLDYAIKEHEQFKK